MADKKDLAVAKIVLRDMKDGTIGVRLECDKEMSLLNNQQDEWTPAMRGAAEVYTRLTNGEIDILVGLSDDMDRAPDEQC